MISETPIVDLRPDDVRDGIEDGTVILVDVREVHELESGMIPASRSMPLSAFDPAALPVGEGRIVFSCAAGVRSRLAIEASRRAGLDLREHLAGGFKGWVASGEPVSYPDD